LELPQSSNSPPYPERLIFEKPIVHSEFDLIIELKNIYIKVPLLQAIKYIPINAKTVQGLCLKKTQRKKIEQKTIQFIVKSIDLMLGKNFIEKYVDPRNPIVLVYINGILVPSPRCRTNGDEVCC